MTLVEVGIRELKAKLSEYIGRVAGGEEIIVTDRGVPVVRLVPFADATLQRGFEEGWIEAPRRTSPSGLASVPRHKSREAVLDALAADRG